MAGLTGVFGGTFDPPHLGHLILAEAGRHALGLDKVLWVVTGQQPLKHDVRTPIEIRLELVQAAIAGNPAFEASRADIDRPGPHYSVGTLAWLRARMPAATFAYLMGEELAARSSQVARTASLRAGVRRHRCDGAQRRRPRPDGS